MKSRAPRGRIDTNRKVLRQSALGGALAAEVFLLMTASGQKAEFVVCVRGAFKHERDAPLTDPPRKVEDFGYRSRSFRKLHLRSLCADYLRDKLAGTRKVSAKDKVQARSNGSIFGVKNLSQISNAFIRKNPENLTTVRAEINC